MFGLRKTWGTIVMVVSFLVLALFASVFYNADQEQKNELVNNSLVQKGGETLGVLLGASEKMSEVNVQKNIGLGKTMADFIARVDWQWLLMGTSTKEVDTSVANVNEASDAELNNSEINNNGASSVETNFNEFVPSETNATTEDTGFWSKLKNSVKEEWKNSQETEAVPLEIQTNDFGQNLFSYQKTNIGAEIIIMSKSGDEYKVPLPFSFLK
ncbi:MAG: hypothetical protein WCN88_04445 [Candidatus Falkowbacteria bacterium]